MPDTVKTLLFVCTHNRCRSILCEALTNHLAGGRLRAFSAGSQPAGAVHPETLAQLEARGIATAGLKSQSWEAFADLAPDVVVTVCDSAAGEQCPLWMGATAKVHWGLPDPSKVPGPGPEQDAAFAAVIATIEGRLQHLLTREPEHLDQAGFVEALVSLTTEEY
ncbi:arsenate reductase ArsC [Pseudohaliea rubra]|uniref:Arsenate reductase n=1 Tax=Pseudohaliea rubra DSM 19751 TaxID=1265313 RepID=A0A095VSA5_9GAMM|nr:arsenate reductase ArsC [Pseudohaliea rubra]KGE04245.1 Arsenate reductase [Pseudohaliea rubra DSM 19751]